MEHQNSAPLFAKMAKVMADLERISATGKNTFHKYSYASIHDVTDAIRSLMGKHGIAFFSSIVNIQSLEGVNVYRIEFQFTFACSETGATMSKTWFAEAEHTNNRGNYNDKAINAASANAMKYFLLRTFIASYDGDVETDAQQMPERQSGKPQGTNSRRMDTAPNLPAKNAWTNDGTKVNALIDRAVDLGLADTRNKAIQFVLTNYYPGRQIAGSKDIQDTFEDALARLEQLAGNAPSDAGK